MKKNVLSKILIISICLIFSSALGMLLLGCSDSDDDSPITWWLDSDGDGFGDSNNETEAFEKPDGYVANAQDCDDTNADVYPDAVDTCGDGIDQNCDGGDGSAEICGDGIDQDCDGVDLVCEPEDSDDDGDGYTENQGDCNDADNTIFPDATDICEDNIDQNCDGSDAICAPDPLDVDNDGDGYTENQGDCNDADNTIFPDATDICEDNIDQNCDGSDAICAPDPLDVDDDGDGYSENGGDCNDNDPNINPIATEICGDGVDQDCNGTDEVCQSEDNKENYCISEPTGPNNIVYLKDKETSESVANFAILVYQGCSYKVGATGMEKVGCIDNLETQNGEIVSFEMEFSSYLLGVWFKYPEDKCN